MPRFSRLQDHECLLSLPFHTHKQSYHFLIKRTPHRWLCIHFLLSRFWLFTHTHTQDHAKTMFRIEKSCGENCVSHVSNQIDLQAVWCAFFEKRQCPPFSPREPTPEPFGLYREKVDTRNDVLYDFEINLFDLHVVSLWLLCDYFKISEMFLRPTVILSLLLTLKLVDGWFLGMVR